jgi:hypothetical protein
MTTMPLANLQNHIVETSRPTHAPEPMSRMFFWRFRHFCPSCGAQIQRNEVRAGKMLTCMTCGASLLGRRRFGWLRWAGVILAVIAARLSTIESLIELYILCVVLVFLFTLGLQYAIGLVFQPHIELCSIAVNDPRAPKSNRTKAT